MKKISKYVEYITIKLQAIYRQKLYKSNGVTLKYMKHTNVDSKTLVIIFSACTRNGIPARYNYVRTLDDINVNKLFILDDFAEDKRGGYYLGPEFKFLVEETTYELIDKEIKNSNAKEVIFCGSSKGGWAALNFGCQYNNSKMIIGSPQYFLGTYLNDPNNLTLKFICGDVTDDKVRYLDSYLKNKLEHNEFISSQSIYLHYSIKEHIYREHINDLINNLNNCNYHIIHDIKNYKEHADVSLYFPKFLHESIMDIIENRNFDTCIKGVIL